MHRSVRLHAAIAVLTALLLPGCAGPSFSYLDVRLAQDGPPQQLGPARIRITGLVVFPRHSGRLLGYDRSPHEGPWLIRALVRAYNHDSHFVPWRWIRDHTQYPLCLDRRAGDLPRLRDIPEPAPGSDSP